MQQRKYTHFREIEPQIIAMREEGMSRTQIAEELGLTWKQVDNWVTRYNKRKTALVAGSWPIVAVKNFICRSAAFCHFISPVSVASFCSTIAATLLPEGSAPS